MKVGFWGRWNSTTGDLRVFHTGADGVHRQVDHYSEENLASLGPPWKQWEVLVRRLDAVASRLRYVRATPDATR